MISKWRSALAIALGAVLFACGGGGGSSGGAKTTSAGGNGNGSGSSAEDGDTGAEGEDDVIDLTGRTPPPPGEAGRAFWAEVQRELGAAKSSEYVHKTQVDESVGKFDYDCSGFVDYALARAVPDAFDAMKSATVKRPLAKHIVTFLGGIPAAGSGRWHPVPRVGDLMPGDVVAWLRPADIKGKNTGHVVVVRATPQASASHEGAFDVPIVDSTASKHGPGDARVAGTNGLGTGEIVLVAGGDGRPTAYFWSRGKKSKEHATTFVLARLD